MFQFICATRYHGKILTEEAMKMHIPFGGKHHMYHIFVIINYSQLSFDWFNVYSFKYTVYMWVVCLFKPQKYFATQIPGKTVV